MNYYEIDFVEDNYRLIIKKLSYRTIFYDEIEKFKQFALWRHDVDFSINRALALAKIENEEQMNATYFLQLGSILYNIFEQGIKEKIFRILDLGHRIGLHFDPTQYAITSSHSLEKFLSFEKDVLEQLFGEEITVFSFHNPTADTMGYKDWQYSGMINTYSDYFKMNVEYCSDSNGYWRFNRLIDFLNEGHERIQILTHPAWWQSEVMSPRDRIQRCIDGRSVETAKKYDGLLQQFGRENVK